jgi:anti-sigma factor ChrR (cupin superfamily)
MHTYDLGEEILVLDGTFSDETGHYSAGTHIMS